MRNRVQCVVLATGLATGLVACGDGRSWRSVLRDYARPDTVERLHVVLDGERARGDTARRLNRALAERNAYLLAQLNDLARIVNEIDRDLGGDSRRGQFRPLVPTGDLEDTLSERELLEAKRRRIAANLERLTSRLRRTDSLWRSAVQRDRAAREQLASSAETLEMFRTLAENRALQFADFEERIDSLQLENRVLADERDRMRDSLSRLSARVSRVYYVVGTREELLASGVVREITVMRRTWNGWHRERQVVPARDPELARLAIMRTSNGSLGTVVADDENADVEQQGGSRAPELGELREVDRYRDTVLVLPPARRARMRVVSAQELRFAEGVGRDGRVNAFGGRLHITDPEGFWEGGRFLVVLVEPERH
jgi:hypothetical protein